MACWCFGLGWLRVCAACLILEKDTHTLPRINKIRAINQSDRSNFWLAVRLCSALRWAEELKAGSLPVFCNRQFDILLSFFCCLLGARAQ